MKRLQIVHAKTDAVRGDRFKLIVFQISVKSELFYKLGKYTHNSRSDWKIGEHLFKDEFVFK
jgi:hypothetical protein